MKRETTMSHELERSKENRNKVNWGGFLRMILMVTLVWRQVLYPKSWQHKPECSQC